MHYNNGESYRSKISSNILKKIFEPKKCSKLAELKSHIYRLIVLT